MNCDNWSFMALRTLRDQTDEKEDDDSLALAQGGRILYGDFLGLEIRAVEEVCWCSSNEL